MATKLGSLGSANQPITVKRLNAFRHAGVVKTTTTKVRVGMEEKRYLSDFERAEHGSWCQTGWSQGLTNCC